MIAPADRFGPWREGIDPAERLARLRSIARLTLGPRGEAFTQAHAIAFAAIWGALALYVASVVRSARAASVTIPE